MRGLPEVPVEAKAELDAQISTDEPHAEPLLSVSGGSLEKGQLPLPCRRAVLGYRILRTGGL